MFRAAAYSRHQRARLAARPPSGQRGAALLMVLMMVAIMLVLSVALVDGVRYNSQRLLNQRFIDLFCAHMMIEYGSESLPQQHHQSGGNQCQEQRLSDQPNSAFILLGSQCI